VKQSPGYEAKLSVYDKPVADNPFENPEGAAPGLPQPSGSPAVERFKSCRWRKVAENGTPECCSHRDVLPMTGANGFDAEAWCPTCEYYKLRRTPKKRDYFGERY
jgi:hypothetical protein